MIARHAARYQRISKINTILLIIMTIVKTSEINYDE